MSADPADAPPAPLSLHTLREAAGLFRYLWPYRIKFALGMACLFIGSGLSLAFPFLAGVLVDAAQLRLTEAIPKNPLHGLDVDHVALALMAVLGLQATFAFFRTLWFFEVGER